MYEEQVKRLRDKASELDYNGWVDTAASLEEAADAIEELSKRVEGLEAAQEISPEAQHFVDTKADSIIDGLQALLASVEERPRWIPVTERLPEKHQIVVAHEGKGTWDFGMFRGISASGNPEYWHWKKNTFKRVKWWMPKDGALPDPPKEESYGREV